MRRMPVRGTGGTSAFVSTAIWEEDLGVRSFSEQLVTTTTTGHQAGHIMNVIDAFPSLLVVAVVCRIWVNCKNGEWEGNKMP